MSCIKLRITAQHYAVQALHSTSATLHSNTLHSPTLK